MSKKITDRTMYLYHVTRRENWYSVGVQGLLAYHSMGAFDAVWCVVGSKLEWALRHTARRHNIDYGDLIIVAVRVRRRNLRRNKVRGAWYHLGDIYPCRIEGIMTVTEAWYMNFDVVPPWETLDDNREGDDQW